MTHFDQIVKEIQEKYDELKFEKDWRFLYGSKSTLENNNGLFLITLNPGGTQVIAGHGRESCEEGNAILNESWKNQGKGKSSLQLQFQEIYRIIAAHLGQEQHQVINESLGGYFIPFRSRNYKELISEKEAIEFSKSIWKRIIDKQKPKLIICIDKTTFSNLSSILSEIGYTKVKEKKELANWAKVTSEYVLYDPLLTVIRFPHLSNYKLFSNEKSAISARNLLMEALVSSRIKD